MLSVETHLAGRLFPGDRLDLIEYMKSVGYKHIEGGHKGTNNARETLGTRDDMFVREGVTLFSSKEEL